MDKPKSLRMRLHEMNRPPEYLQAYPAEEMDDYLCGLEADALSDHLELSGAVSLLKDMKAENARLRDLLRWALTYVETEHERGSNLPTEVKALELAKAALGKED
jgi:hypothetical protein